MDEISKPEICELPFRRKNSSNEFKNEVEERRKSLGILINRVGFTNARKMHKSLSQQYNISERMIYKDFNWIKGHWKPSDFGEIKIDIRIAQDRILSESLMLINTANTFDEKIRAIGAVIATSKHMTEQLEIWGVKPKAEDMSIESEEQPIKKEIFEVYQELAEAYIRSFKERMEDITKIEELLKDKLGKELSENIFKEIQEKIFFKRIFDIMAMKNKDGIIERFIPIGVSTNEEIKK